MCAAGREAMSINAAAVGNAGGERERVPLWWCCVLNFGLVLWVVRVPAATTVLGLALLGLTTQAQDLFVEFSRASYFWMFYFVFILVAAWALPTHYAARLLVDSDRRLQRRLAIPVQPDRGNLRKTICLQCSATCLPRLLGFATFAAVLIGIWRSHLNLPDSDQPEVIAAVNRALLEVAVLVAVAALAYLVYVYRRDRIRLPAWLKGLNTKLLGWLWRRISPGRGAGDEEDQDFGRLILSVLFLIFIGIFYFGADFAGGLFPRAMGVPFILGGWLPFMSYLSGVGRQIRAPLIFILFLAISVLTLVLGDNHSVRRIDADADRKPMPLQDAVTMWMQANDCDGTPAACPRPVIVAAAGGASRAGFFMASVLGYFMQEAAGHGLDPNAMRNRLFAISSVSGGSMGAVMVTAALNSKADSRQIPCAQPHADQWWGDTINNWRDCFEALTSGDFLTADFFGFAFNDMFSFGWWRDRAAVLEDSWRNRYRDLITEADKPAAPPSCAGLECPFLGLRPSRDHWIPLLVLNGASEATGGRIITTSLAMTYMPSDKSDTNKDQNKCSSAVGPPPCPLFVQADRFHDLLGAQFTPPDSWFGWFGGFERYLLGDSAGNDIRLSTAALNSARFPLISPPGTVRNKKQMAVDRIVDGGYFENYGALGAKELALGVHDVQPDLKPLVIVISNDPSDLLNPSDDSGQTYPPQPRPQVDRSEFITDIVAPVTTVDNARTAHGILGVDQLRTALHAALAECKILVLQVRVWPTNGKSLSMSWWESSVVQRQLHRQTEPGHDKNQNKPHLDAIWAALQRPASCGAATQ
jgi:hypothetical protein